MPRLARVMPPLTADNRQPTRRDRANRPNARSLAAWSVPVGKAVRADPNLSHRAD